MKKVFSKLTAVTVLLSASCVFNVANASLIFSEDFSGGSSALQNSTDVTWADTSGGGFEVYTFASAGPRGMSGTYDHDNDASTAQVNIPGAIEVNDDIGNETLTASFTLDSVIEVGQEAVLSFFAGARNNAIGATVEILNLTQDTSLSGLFEPTATTIEWTFNSFSFDSAAASIGDVLQITWLGGGTSSATGLEVADVNFSVVDVPAPATTAILALGLAGLGFRRFKK